MLPASTATGTTTSALRTSWTGKLALLIPVAEPPTTLIDRAPMRTLAAPVSKSVVVGAPTSVQLSVMVSDADRSGSAIRDGAQMAGMRDARRTRRMAETMISGVHRAG